MKKNALLDQKAELDENQFLTFLLEAEIYGIGILHIKEIIEFGGVTNVPMMPEFIKGVINVRGNVVPVIDLKLRFGKQKTEISRKTCIIIVEVNYEEDMLEIGILVDGVNEVIDIPGDSIEPPPQFGANIRTDFIAGMGKINDSFIVLLNHEKVLSVMELSAIEQFTDRQTETGALESAPQLGEGENT